MEIDKRLILGFNKEDSDALKEIIGLVLREGVMVAEIGVWLGTTTLIIAESVLRYHGTIFCVDHWRGSDGTATANWARGKDIYAMFKQRMIEKNIWNIIQPMIMESVVAASKFEDKSLDLVFIDGDHRYDFVKQDILRWLPKIRDGGILCGHDSEYHYSSLLEKTKESIDRDCNNREFIPAPPYRPIHPGVIKALYDCLHDNYTIMPGSRVWYLAVER